MTGERATTDDEMVAFFRRHPLVYAAYRIDYLLKHDRDISETGEIPFSGSPVFPVALVGYLVVIRLRGLLDPLTGGDDPPSLGTDGHLFVMSSESGYRTTTFLDVAAKLQSAGTDTLLLCSPATESAREEWAADGYTTVSHRDLHGHIPLWRTARNALYSVWLIWHLRRQVGVPLSRLSLCYNYLLLETVKYDSMRAVTSGTPTIHTCSPMPYLIASTAPERVYAYQHGLQIPIGGRIMSVPFFAPLNYLVWGEPWRENFETYSHPDATVNVVGSAWYDHLATKRPEERDPAYDILVVSGTQGLTDAELEADFERLVRETIDVCDSEGLSLAVKLHPLEDGTWYEERGWDDYIVDFDDIDEALLSARLSITDVSTAFVESAVLGVPAIVADLPGHGLDSLAPIDFVTFTNGPEVAAAIRDALAGETEWESADHPIRLGGSTERIVAAVRDDRSSESVAPDR